MIPYSRKFSRDPIFADGRSAKISLSNFRGWTFTPAPPTIPWPAPPTNLTIVIVIARASFELNEKRLKSLTGTAELHAYRASRTSSHDQSYS